MNNDYDCIRSLIVRNPSDQSPVDFNVNINIEAKDYDKIHIQLLSVGIDQQTSGSFPIDANIRHRTFIIESNMGQMVFDTNNKKTFLGSVNVNREFIRGVHADSIKQPIIELASIPNGNYQFSLKDKSGVIPPIKDASDDTAIQGLTLVFQVFLSKNEIKRNQINL